MEMLTEIGRVESAFHDPADPFEMRKHESRIVLREEYLEGLFCIEESSHIQVIFGFHLSSSYSLRGPTYTGEVKGVFASRSPHRPSRLGVTTVELVKVDGSLLIVKGLDAIDGSPVYDIKPHAAVFDEKEEKPDRRADWDYASPRNEMVRMIRSRDLAGCLTVAGKLHGHYCPGLSLGVYAAVEGMNRLVPAQSDGMESLLAIVEVNSCFADGVQVVTGCTLGNNALIYEDYGKTAVTLATRMGKTGLRVSVKPDFRAMLERDYPAFSRLFDQVVRKRGGSEADMAAFKMEARKAAFGMLSWPANALFDVKESTVEVPGYAPMVESLVCGICGEQMMETKAVREGQRVLCRACSGKRHPRVTGEGIVLGE